MAFEVWDLAPSALPAHSHLYSLPPMGIGTPQVESLTSYLTRLAEAHAVSPGTLIRHEILPKLPVSPKRPTFGALHSLNGMGSCFEQWVALLEELTARNDLYALTLLPWRGALASGGVLRRHRAWCLRCYQECRYHGQIASDPLLWTLAPVTHCPTHEVSLEEYCPHCRQRLFLLSARVRPECCAHCNRWLGDGLPAPRSAESRQDRESQLWVARVVGEFLALGITKNKISPDRLQLRHNILRAIADWARGNRLLFCRVAKIADKTLIEWLNGDCLPSLTLLIRLSRNLRLPPSRLLFEQIGATDPVWIQARQIVQKEEAASIVRTTKLRSRPEYPITRGRRWALSPYQRDAAKAEVRVLMEVALKQDIPRSVRDIFRSLGYRNCSMGRFWFPELCTAIVAKRKQRFNRYQHELRIALSEDPPPTVAQVAQRLGISLNKLRKDCPKLCTALSLRLPDRRCFQVVKTEEALNKALEEPPVPLAKVALRLRRNANKLRVAFPDLCRRLHERYIDHRSSERQQVNLIYENEVHHAIDEITAASKYPSRKRILSLISKKNPSLKSIYLTGKAVQRIRKELTPTTGPHTSEFASRG